MLWIAIYIPELSLQIALRGQPDADALVISAGADNRPVIYAANDAARQAGIKANMSVAAARALVEPLLVIPRQPERERCAIHNLACWAGQFTPAVSIHQDEGLLLDVAATLTMHQGLATLINKLRVGLHTLGYRVCIGVAPTPMAAWVFAKARHHGYDVRMCRHIDTIATRVADLPVALLDWPHDSVSQLAGLGIIRFADCLALPADGFVKRFGKTCLFDLQRVIGSRPDPRLSFVPPDSYRAHTEFGFDINDATALLFPLKRLLTEMEGYLRGRGSGVSAYRVTLFHPSRLKTTIHIGMAKVERATDRLLSLAREHLHKTTLPDHVLAMSIEIDHTQPFQEISASWLPDPQHQPDSWYRLIDKLSARLGADNVYQLQTVDDHRPERSLKLVTAAAASSHAASLNTTRASSKNKTPMFAGALRPTFLLATPRKLLSHEGRPTCHGAVDIISGPERIETGWWDGQPASRDYFVGRNRHGETMWLYRNHQGNQAAGADWYLQGYFA